LPGDALKIGLRGEDKKIVPVGFPQLSALDLHQWLCLDGFRYATRIPSNDCGTENASIVHYVFDRLRLYRSL
jgi:hypothetical protein